MEAALGGVLAALIAGIVSLAIAQSSKRDQEAALRHQEERLRSEVAMQEERLLAEAKLQQDRLRTELRTEFMAEEAIRQLLQHPDWEQRSFDEIKRRLGGFEDNELRRFLVRAGAVAFWSESGNKEFWGLRDRNADKLGRQGGQRRTHRGQETEGGTR